jgi:C-terminal processing protease CtpA/Prc
VITDSRAISASESVLSYFEGYKLGTIIGTPSAGTNGNINTINLSGVYNIIFTGMHVVKHDGSRFHGVGTTPDIIVERTILGIRDGRDELLEKAMELARKQ